MSVAPFRNDTGIAGDAWLQTGLADMLIRMLDTHPGVAALSEKNEVYLPPQNRVRFKVGGLFQHTQNWLRIFVQLKDNSGKLERQFTIETPYPLHKQFFTGLREAAGGILDKAGVSKKKSENLLKAVENETANVRAYENYIKGREAFESYDPNKMEVALIWFQEARRDDSEYPMAYRGMLDVFDFLGLYNKAAGVPYGQYVENAENTLNALIKRGRKTGFKEKITDRFLEAQVHFVVGERALARGDAAKAASELSQAARLVPEDPITALYLSQAYEKLGQATLAGTFKNRAEEINPCLKGR